MKLKLTLGAILSSLTLGLVAHAEPLAVGAAAPDVSAPDQDGKTVNFKDVYAKGVTLVYFYPKSDTPGCTKQACSIRDDWSELQSKGIQVLGVSSDKVEAQKKFQEKHKLPFTIISDSEHQVSTAFGVPTILGITKRQSFLVKNGKIAWVMPSASTGTHAKDVLEAFKELK
jgi:peroxiredoxin Q/BCP